MIVPLYFCVLRKLVETGTTHDQKRIFRNRIFLTFPIILFYFSVCLKSNIKQQICELIHFNFVLYLNFV